MKVKNNVNIDKTDKIVIENKSYISKLIVSINKIAIAIISAVNKFIYSFYEYILEKINKVYMFKKIDDKEPQFSIPSMPSKKEDYSKKSSLPESSARKWARRLIVYPIYAYLCINLIATVGLIGYGFIKDHKDFFYSPYPANRSSGANGIIKCLLKNEGNDPVKILNCNAKCDVPYFPLLASIQHCHRRTMTLIHPDRCEISLADKATQIFNSAYSYLLDENKKGKK